MGRLSPEPAHFFAVKLVIAKYFPYDEGVPRPWLFLLLVVTVFVTASTLAYLHLIPRGLFLAPWDKVAHFAIYGALSLALAWCMPSRPALAWTLPLALAAADELTQSLSRFRSPDWLDFSADAAGIFLAIVFLRRSPRALQTGNA